jgi:DNA-cytosine methyltransferase
VLAGSLFSGVGGMDLGLHRAGFRHAFFAEQDAYRRGILERHWPGIPVYDDVRAVGRSTGRGRRDRADVIGDADRPTRTRVSGSTRRPNPPSLDLLAGGFPCQDLSVAGRRRGLAGERSGLFFEFARVADELVRPGGFVLIENVPGLLSSHNGRDFAVVLATLAELGFHDLAWRVLDSRYFGVPQRRRRVFILARRACGRVCCEVLLEPEGGGGDSAAGGEAGTRVAASLTRWLSWRWRGRRREPSRGDEGERQDTEDFVVAAHVDVCGVDASEDGTGRGTPLTAIQDGRAMDKAQNGLGISEDGTAYTLDKTGAQAIAGAPVSAVAENQRGEVLEPRTRIS